MVGIYKITNTLNGKFYIGQSNNIERRFKEHLTKGAASRIPLDIAIQKYGASNFKLEVLEECEVDELNEKEYFWIKETNAIELGYNLTQGGDQQSVGENNGRAKLKESDIVDIRVAYSQKKRRKEVYEKYKNIISFSTFASIWDGSQWAHIMPEVYTEELKRYYSKESTNGENSSSAKFTNEEVFNLRQRYIKESAREIYQDYLNRCSYDSFQKMLWGHTYKEVPIYRKKQKEWINL